jgi:predicted transcriptional regulator
MLKFPDDTQIRVNGLNEILADLYSEGRQANQETAEEIIKRLEARKNFIPSSDRARKEYAYVVLKEYREYVNERAGDSAR